MGRSPFATGGETIDKPHRDTLEPAADAATPCGDGIGDGRPGEARAPALEPL